VRSGSRRNRRRESALVKGNMLLLCVFRLLHLSRDWSIPAIPGKRALCSNAALRSRAHAPCASWDQRRRASDVLLVGLSPLCPPSYRSLKSPHRPASASGTERSVRAQCQQPTIMSSKPLKSWIQYQCARSTQLTGFACHRPPLSSYQAKCPPPAVAHITTHGVCWISS